MVSSTTGISPITTIAISSTFDAKTNNSGLVHSNLDIKPVWSAQLSLLSPWQTLSLLSATKSKRGLFTRPHWYSYGQEITKADNKCQQEKFIFGTDVNKLGEALGPKRASNVGIVANTLRRVGRLSEVRTLGGDDSVSGDVDYQGFNQMSRTCGTNKHKTRSVSQVAHLQTTGDLWDHPNHLHQTHQTLVIEADTLARLSMFSRLSRN